MELLDTALIMAALAAVIWVAFKTGWEARGSRDREALEQDERGWQELSYILTYPNDDELARLDKEFGCNSLQRLREMSPAAVDRLRAGEGRLFHELSDWLLLRERRSDRFKAQMAADTSVDPAIKARCLGSRTPA